MTPDQAAYHARRAVAVARQYLDSVEVPQFAVNIVCGAGDNGYCVEGYSHEICPEDLSVAMSDAALRIAKGEGIT